MLDRQFRSKLETDSEISQFNAELNRSAVPLKHRRENNKPGKSQKLGIKNKEKKFHYCLIGSVVF